jgi:hypothetical protein
VGEFWHYEFELKDRKKRVRTQLRDLALYYHLPRFTDPLARSIPAFQPLLAEWTLLNEQLAAFDAELVRRLDAMSTTDLLEHWNAAAAAEDADLIHLFYTNVQIRIQRAHEYYLEIADTPLEDLEVVNFETILAMYDDFIAFFTRPDLHIKCGTLLYIQITTERRRWQRLYKRFLEYTTTRARAVMESTHARLGGTSWLHALDPDLAHHIVASTRVPYAPAPWEGSDSSSEDNA